MRKLVLDKIKLAIEDGDDEIIESYGEFEVIEKMTDQELLNVIEFLFSFRG